MSGLGWGGQEEVPSHQSALFTEYGIMKLDLELEIQIWILEAD
jgi:hypothetical protein